MAALSQTEGSFKENVAAMEKLFTEKIGYQKEDNSSQAKIQRHHDSNMIRQAITEAELELWFERTNHSRNMKNTFKGKRYLGVLNMLYGNESEIEGFFTAPTKKTGCILSKKAGRGTDKIPHRAAPEPTRLRITASWVRTNMNRSVSTWR